MISDEKIIHYLWKYRLFRQKDLISTDGSRVELVHCGVDNDNAGPDFSNSKIRINDTLWAGAVEIHINASDWLKHNHQNDKSYDNVILHVVWNNDTEVFRTDGTQIPALELKEFVDYGLISRIDFLRKSQAWIPCESLISHIDSFTVAQFLDRTLIERLEYKSAYISEVYAETKGSWEDTFYITLARNFGFSVNITPFEILAKSLPQQILAKHKNNPLQIESLIFGVAGFLDITLQDAYPQQLKAEFNFLQRKYKLAPLDRHWWKFARTRPDNFPTIRLAQFAALVYKSSHLFSKLLEIDKVEDYRALFKNLELNTYWSNHYDFDKVRKGVSMNALGDSSIDVLLINAIVPILFFYGKLLGIAHFQDKALNLLQSLKPEHNSVVGRFKDYGLKITTASDSQGVLQLKKFYCDQKKCLNCAIGIKILKR